MLEAGFQNGFQACNGMLVNVWRQLSIQPKCKDQVVAQQIIMVVLYSWSQSLGLLCAQLLMISAPTTLPSHNGPARPEMYFIQSSGAMLTQTPTPTEHALFRSPANTGRNWRTKLEMPDWQILHCYSQFQEADWRRCWTRQNDPTRWKRAASAAEHR